jgi:endonuclease YncB( thermonuclease family)
MQRNNYKRKNDDRYGIILCCVTFSRHLIKQNIRTEMVQNMHLVYVEIPTWRTIYLHVELINDSFC